MRPLMSSSASNNSPPPEEFDEFAEDYDGALNQGLKFTGESKDYFAQGRAKWTARRLEEFGVGRVGSCLDFGCGTGSATPHLQQTFDGVNVIGIDPSVESIELAKKSHGGASTEFCTNAEFDRQGALDLGYCNGVFHHILPDDRDGAMSTVFEALKPGGVFALWENNPWNPATRFVMSRVPFDRDAIMLWPRETRGRMRRAGFEILKTDFLFVFPGFLGFLRGIEPMISWFPTGGQYVVFGRKPE